MKIARIAGLALALLPALAWPQAGIVRGETARGEGFLVGGVGEEEVAALRLARSSYSLSVQTAARRSGEFLADVHLRITDAQGQPVFEQDLPGPWLLVKLHPGRYKLQASRDGQVDAAEVNVPAQGLREQMFYFDVTEPRPDDPVRYPPAAR